MIFINPYSFVPSDTLLQQLEALSDELQLMETERYSLERVSAAEVDELPTTGKSTVVVANLGGQAHVRVFDGNGDIVADKSEAELRGNQRKQRLRSMVSGGAVLTEKEIRAALRCASQASNCDLPEDRESFIERKRDETWGNPLVLAKLREAVGNKCWYSEVSLDGSDPDVDHFLPKGRVREIDGEFEHTGETSRGYWWFAFEFRNFRLTCQHSNQRRVDEDSDGGKWDYFPVRDTRAPELTSWEAIKSQENPLPLDPCSSSDASLLCFDSDGVPCASKKANDFEKERVRLSIWLYHLKKKETRTSRTKAVQTIQADLRTANSNYLMWARGTDDENRGAKDTFDANIAKIIAEISPTSVFAGAKQCAVRLAMAKYDWIPEFIPLPSYE